MSGRVNTRTPGARERELDKRVDRAVRKLREGAGVVQHMQTVPGDQPGEFVVEVGVAGAEALAPEVRARAKDRGLLDV